VSAIAERAVFNPRHSVGRAVFAATIGNVLEWYDFTIYAAFALAGNGVSPYGALLHCERFA
jgi:MFS transporter, MHS family, proline/betaine transporter